MAPAIILKKKVFLPVGETLVSTLYFQPFGPYSVRKMSDKTKECKGRVECTPSRNRDTNTYTTIHSNILLK